MAALQIGDLVLGERPRVVAAGGDAEVGALLAARGADLVELRIDLFDDPSTEQVTAALERLSGGGRPILATVRAASEGGRAMDERQRRELYEAALPYVQAIDVEIASRDLSAHLAPMAAARDCRLVLSAHDFDGTPAATVLTDLVGEGRSLGADLVKLATRVDDAHDLQTLLGVTLAERAQGIVTVGMGPFGALCRVVLPAAGSSLTYGCVGRPTAPGQLAVTDLRDLLDRLVPA